MAKQGDLERMKKDTVVVDRKRKNTGIDTDLRGSCKKGCIEGGRGIATATDAAVDRMKSETDRNLKIKSIIKNYPTSSSAEDTVGGGVQVGGDAELVQHFAGWKGKALNAQAKNTASQNTLRVSDCAADRVMNRTVQ